MCEEITVDAACNTLKHKYPRNYRHLKKTFHNVAKDSERKLTDPHVTIYKKIVTSGRENFNCTKKD